MINAIKIIIIIKTMIMKRKKLQAKKKTLNKINGWNIKLNDDESKGGIINWFIIIIIIIIIIMMKI